MTKIFEVLGIITWILCFTKEMLFILKNTNSKESYFKDFKFNAFKLIRLDKLLLITIFIIYVNFNKDFVTSLVFTVISLYLFINKFYENGKKERFLKTVKKNWLTIIITYIFVLIPFIYLLLTKNYDNTSIVLLLYIFFSYFIIGIAKLISGFVIKNYAKN